MMKKIFMTALAGILVFGFMQAVSAAYATYTYYPNNAANLHISLDDDYGYRGGVYSYGAGRLGDYDSSCRYFDRGDLKWHTNKVCQWVENGNGWKEETIRARAVVWQSNSYDDRYNMNSGLPSGIAFGGDEQPAQDYSNWRYKHAFDPRIDNTYVMGNGYYYYQPRYDLNTQTYNWRY